MLSSPCSDDLPLSLSTPAPLAARAMPRAAPLACGADAPRGRARPRATALRDGARGAGVGEHVGRREEGATWKGSPKTRL